MKEVFLAVSGRIGELVPGVAFVDLETGQLETGAGMPVVFPAVFVDVAYPACEDIDTGRQLVRIEVTLRVAFDASLDETASITPGEVRARALEKFDVLDGIHDVLQGWETGRFGNLSRVSSVPERRDDGLKVYKMSYVTTAEV